jgi:hypothetical protein
MKYAKSQRMQLENIQKHSPVLMGMFRCKPASLFVERYHGVVSCALNMEDLISNNFCKYGE